MERDECWCPEPVFGHLNTTCPSQPTHTTAEPDAGDVEALASLLAEHELMSGNAAVRPKGKIVGSFVCRCLHVQHEVENVGYQDLHARHLAAVLASDWLAAHDAEVRRETAERVWVEGWDAAVDAAEKCYVAGGDITCGECAICMTPNPYAREEASRG